MGANNHVRVVRVANVSPRDVADERAVLAKVVAELNRRRARTRDVRLDLWQWEVDARPGLFDGGPQAGIDTLLSIEDVDVVVGIFWTRFGTPVPGADSGTEHELRKAWDLWQTTGRPEVLLYFCNRPFAPREPSDLVQWTRVLEFRKSMPEQQFWWPYGEVDEFAQNVREHLEKVLEDIVAADAGEATQANVAARPEGSARESTADSGFMLWLDCVGLPDSFPTLTGSGRDRPIRLTRDHRRRVLEIRDWLASRDGPIIVVSLAPGHGVTTLTNHMHDQIVMERGKSALVPARLTVGDAMSASGALVSDDQLAERIRRRLLHRLALGQWSSTERGKRLTEALGGGAVELVNLLSAGGVSIDDLPWSGKLAEGPLFGASLVGLLGHLASEHALFACILVDGSSSQHTTLTREQEAAMPELVEALSRIQEPARRSNGVVFNTVLFTNTNIAPRVMQLRLRGAPEQELVEIPIRGFNPAEFFALLMDRYGADLESKLDPSLLIGLAGPETRLDMTASLLQNRLHHKLARFEDVPYRISDREGGNDV